MAPVAVGTTERAGSQAGRRHADKRPSRRPARLYVALLALGVVAGAALWGFLVRAAIDFGQAGRDGEPVAWLVCIAATLGAALCLLLVFVLVARIWSALRAPRAPRVARVPGGRRAAR